MLEVWQHYYLLTRRHTIDTAQMTMKKDEILRHSQAVCDGLSQDENSLWREILTHAGNRWSLGIIHSLGVGGRLRHADISRKMKGITQRMLTRTLRQLERDGLVLRYDMMEVPPRVEYELSELGMELLLRVTPLWTWIVENGEGFRQSRERFDARPVVKPRRF